MIQEAARGVQAKRAVARTHSLADSVSLVTAPRSAGSRTSRRPRPEPPGSGDARSASERRRGAPLSDDEPAGRHALHHPRWLSGAHRRVARNCQHSLDPFDANIGGTGWWIEAEAEVRFPGGRLAVPDCSATASSASPSSPTSAAAFGPVGRGPSWGAPRGRSEVAPCCARARAHDRLPRPPPCRPP